MDRAIGYSVLGKAVGILGRFVTIFLVLTFLSEREQGYYYTFYSVLALTMFLDLGLTNVLQIFASHEKPRLAWGEKGRLHGDPEALARLQSLLRLGLIWFGVAAVLLMLLLYPGGIAFFVSQDSGDRSVWMLPWLFAAVVSAVAVMLAPVKSVLTGCGRVKELRFLGILQQLLGYPASWIVFIYGGGLFAGPVFFACGLLVLAAWLWRTHSGFLKQNITFRRQDALPWREIWPLQWRTGLNWMSGYLIFHILNPLVFALFGPVEAGQMGMSLMLAQQVCTVAFFWINTKSPVMGMLWAKRDYGRLDKMFVGAVSRMLLVSTTGCGLLVFAIWFLERLGSTYSARILDPSLFLLVVIVQILNTIILSESLYLRANKKEPFVLVSIIQGVLLFAVSWYLGKHFGLQAMLLGQVVVGVLSVAACTLILLSCRRKWQSAGVSLKDLKEDAHE